MNTLLFILLLSKRIKDIYYLIVLSMSTTLFTDKNTDSSDSK